MGFWMAAGGGLGYACSILISKTPYIKNNYYVKKYKYRPFWIFFLTLTYHGYKLMNFTKRKGVRELAKDPENLA